MQPLIVLSVFCWKAILTAGAVRDWGSFATNPRTSIEAGYTRQSNGPTPTDFHQARRVLHLGQLGAPQPEDMTWDDTHYPTQHSNTNHNNIGRTGERSHDLVPQVEVVYDDQGRSRVESIRQVDPQSDRPRTGKYNVPYWTAQNDANHKSQPTERPATDHLGREVINGVAYLEINHGPISSNVKVPSGSIHYSQAPFPTSTRTAERPSYTNIVQTPQAYNAQPRIQENVRDNMHGSQATATTEATHKGLVTPEEYSLDDEVSRADTEVDTTQAQEPHHSAPVVFTQEHSHDEDPDEDEYDDYEEEPTEEERSSNKTTSVVNKVNEPKPDHERTQNTKNQDNKTAERRTVAGSAEAPNYEVTTTPAQLETLPETQESESNRTITTHESKEQNDVTVEDYSEEYTAENYTTISPNIDYSIPQNNDNNNSNIETIDVINHSTESVTTTGSKDPIQQSNDHLHPGPVIESSLPVNVNEGTTDESDEFYDADEYIEDDQSLKSNGTTNKGLTVEQEISLPTQATTSTETATEMNSSEEEEEGVTITTTTTIPTTKTASVKSLTDPFNQTEIESVSSTENAPTPIEGATLYDNAEIVTETTTTLNDTTKPATELPVINVSDSNVMNISSSGAADETVQEDSLSAFVTVNPSMFYGIARDHTDSATTTTSTVSPVVPSSSSKSNSKGSLPTTESTPSIKTVTSDVFPKTTEANNDFALGLEGLFQLKFRPGSQSGVQSKRKTARIPKMIEGNINPVSDSNKGLAGDVISSSISSMITTTTAQPPSSQTPTSHNSALTPTSTNQVNNIPSLFSNGDPSGNMMNFPWGFFDTKNIPQNAAPKDKTAVISLATTPSTNTNRSSTTTAPNVPKVNLFTKKSTPTATQASTPPSGPSKKFNLFASLTNATNFSYNNNNVRKRDHRRPELRPLATRPVDAWQPSIEPAPEDRPSANDNRPRIVGKLPREGRPNTRLILTEKRLPPPPSRPPPVVPPIADSDIDLIHRGTPPAPRNGKQPISSRARTTLLMSASLITGAAIFFATLLAVCRRRAKNARLLRRRAVEAFIHDAASEASSNYGYGGSIYSYGQKGLLPPRV